MASPILPLAALALGVGAYVYFTREAEASDSEPSGPPSNFLTAMTDAEYQQVQARLQTQAKPLVLIKFRGSLGSDAISAIQSSGMAAARAYPEIWVLSLFHGVGTGDGVDTQCGPDDGGVVVAAPYGGGADSEIYEVCWPKQADADLVAQNINIAAVEAKNLAAQTPNA